MCIYIVFLEDRVHITPCLHHFRLDFDSVLTPFRQWLIEESLLVTEEFLLVTEDSLLVVDRTFNHL